MLAYDRGRLFVVNFDGLLRTFDAETGAAIWSQKYPIGFVTKPPVAAGGMVFLASQDTVIAVDEDYGGLLWKADTLNSGSTSPAISADGVFVNGSCHLYKLSLLSGDSLWKYEGPCSGAGNKIPVYSNGRLVVRDDSDFPVANSPNAIFDATTGTILAPFPSRRPRCTGRWGPRIT